MSGAIHGIENAVTNPAALVGGLLGGGVGGLTGATAAGNAVTGQPLGSGLQGALGTDITGLGIGMGLGGGLGSGLSMAGRGAGMFPVAGGGGMIEGGGVPNYGSGMYQSGGYNVDPNTGNVMGGQDPFSGFSIDPNTGDVIPNQGTSGGPEAIGSAQGAGSSIGNLLSGLGGGIGGILGAGLGGPGGPSIAGMAPGLAALAYARNQPGLDTSRLSDTFNAAGANAPLFTQAAIDPLKQAQAGGYGDLLQSQGARGIRGSSFGDQDIANYLTTTGRGISDAGASAAQQALGLQGNLAGNLALLQNQAQLQKNNLYGRAFDMLGRGLNPTGQGSGMQTQPGMRSPNMPTSPNLPSAGMLGNLGIGGIANGFGNMLSGVGSGLGNIFGSTGSSIWGGPQYMNPLQNAGMDSINFGGGFDAGF